MTYLPGKCLHPLHTCRTHTHKLGSNLCYFVPFFHQQNMCGSTSHTL
uniref:Uncharacterized protein n=1 Tax=Ciona intestinalis TaxID=7719 RepID=H2XLG6_CIOIN